jgi:AraC-like DNA-binding protein
MSSALFGRINNYRRRYLVFAVTRVAAMDQPSRDKMAPIPLHKVALISPFSQFLSEVGAPVRRGFQRAGLPYGVLENLDNCVPSQRFYSFVRDMALREGIEELGFHVGRRFGADVAAPHVSERIGRAPTLYQGLVEAIDLANRSVSRSQMGVLRSLNSEYAYFYHLPSCDRGNPVIRQIGWLGIMSLIGMVRVFTGPRWQPAEIGLMPRYEPCPTIRDLLGSTRLRLGSPCSYIRVDKTQLSMPPRGLDDAQMKCPTLPNRPVPRDFLSSFKQVLHTYIEDRNLSIDFSAELCGTSKRGLQRKLKELGSSYSKVLDQVRFDVASRMLQEPNAKVLDVAFHLGYSDPTHFARSFRRVAGVTPREYRSMHHH